LRPDDASSNAGLYPYLAGVSVAQAIENSLGFSPELKWPNDLLLNDRKFCGLLSEAEFDNGNVRYIILGIGINVEHKIGDIPDDLLETATSIRIENRIRTDRVDLLCEIMHCLEKNYAAVTQNGFATIIEEWKSRCPKLGKKISVQQQDEKLTGIFENLENDGTLLLQTEDGQVRKIVAGDLSH
jgi:BirA family biotin operon repressor/biotin-[acetyl-CoA-carboxylase] ligase